MIQLGEFHAYPSLWGVPTSSHLTLPMLQMDWTFTTQSNPSHFTTYSYNINEGGALEIWLLLNPTSFDEKDLHFNLQLEGLLHIRKCTRWTHLYAISDQLANQQLIHSQRELCKVMIMLAVSYLL